MSSSSAKLHAFQERMFDIFIYFSYIFIILSFLGFTGANQQFIISLDYYVRVYICLFLLWRFNPFRSYYEFTNLDRKIAFSAGLFILTTTVLKNTIKDIGQKIKGITKSPKQSNDDIFNVNAKI